MTTRIPLDLLFLASLLGSGLSAPLDAGVCTVLGTHATIQEAVEDSGCGQIDLSDRC